MANFIVQRYCLMLFIFIFRKCTQGIEKDRKKMKIWNLKTIKIKVVEYKKFKLSRIFQHNYIYIYIIL